MMPSSQQMPKQQGLDPTAPDSVLHWGNMAGPSTSSDGGPDAKQRSKLSIMVNKESKYIVGGGMIKV